MHKVLFHSEDRQVEQQLSAIHQNGNQLLQLVNNMMDLSKLESGKIEINWIQSDMVSIVRYIIDSIKSLIEAKSIDFSFKYSSDRFIMDFDPLRLQQVLSNLLSNAYKHTPAGGRIGFELCELKDEKSLLITITDSGAGIDPMDLPYIFDRFYQSSQNKWQMAGEGSGIGLAMAKELVQLMNGSIDVQSELGKGSTFRVKLAISHDAPLVESPFEGWIDQKTVPIDNFSREEVHIPEDGEVEPELSSILVVEDNMDVRQYLNMILKSHYKLHFSSDGKDGFSKALELIPDIIISDIMMPEMDGNALCQAVKSNVLTSHIPVILLTAKADHESRLIGIKGGADHYMEKPFDSVELQAVLQNLISHRKSLFNYYNRLIKEGIDKEEKLDVEDEFILRLKQHILDNISDENWGIHELCQSVYVSRTQLHNKLKALTNKSASHFIRSVRLNKAREILNNSNKTVSEVAYAVGFKELSYFSKLYKLEFSELPSQTKS